MAIPLATLVVAAVAVSAALLIREDVAVTPRANAPDVVFQEGDDYAAINSAGFADLTVGAGGTSASLAVSGVAGAALVSVEDVLEVRNADATQNYTVVLERSAALDGAITQFRVDVRDESDSTLIVSWDADASATSAAFALPAGETYDLSVYPLIAAGTAAGDLAAFDLRFHLTPA